MNCTVAMLKIGSQGVSRTPPFEDGRTAAPEHVADGRSGILADLISPSRLKGISLEVLYMT